MDVEHGSVTMKPTRWFIFVAAILSAWATLLRAGTFEETVAPVLERRCVVCHGPALQNGQVRLDTLSPDFINDTEAAKTWKVPSHRAHRQLTFLRRSHFYFINFSFQTHHPIEPIFVRGMAQYAARF